MQLSDRKDQRERCCQGRLKEQWLLRINRNKGNFKDQIVLYMNLNMDNIWLVIENGTFRK